MPDRSPGLETREGQSDNSVPVGIPLAAVIAILFFLVPLSSILARKALMWPLRG